MLLLERFLFLSLFFRQIGIILQPKVLGVLQQDVLLGFHLANLVHGFVGMFDYMELVDDGSAVLEGFLNPLAETERHIAGDEIDSFRIASMCFKVGSEPPDSCRILAIRHEDDFALGKVGDDRDVVMPLLAGFIHADGGDFGIVLQRASLVHIMMDEPP